MFEVQVYDAFGKLENGARIPRLDVFVSSGCRAVYSRTIENIFVGKRGVLRIGFVAQKENAMISSFQIFTKDPSYVPTPRPIPGPPLGQKKKGFKVDVGGRMDTLVLNTKKTSTTSPVTASKAAGGEMLRTSRFGSAFQYNFNLKPGRYTIILSFSENFPNFCTNRGLRLFDVFIAGKVVLKNFDIFRKADGCFKGYDAKFKVTVKDKPLVIRFSSLKNFAQINVITITAA